MKRLGVVLLLAACVLACRRDASIAGKGPAEGVREPAMAGKFYPSDPGALRRAVEEFLREAVPPMAERPVALVSPHAGYIYSGQIAADAWRQAQGGKFDLVVILGTNHTAPEFRGVAVHPGTGFRTPLGVAEIDRSAAEALVAADPGCAFLWKATNAISSAELAVLLFETNGTVRQIRWTVSNVPAGGCFRVPVTDANRAAIAAALPACEVTLACGSNVVDRGVGANVLGSPALALVYLRDVLATQPWAPPLAAGEIVTTGTITDAQPVAPGETWRATFGALPLHPLSATLRD